MSNTNPWETIDRQRTSPEYNLTTHPDPQLASPLFNLFPPEIRAEIFAIAVSSFLDTSRPYAFDSYWYRPGYTARKRTDLSLLETCKRIYTEAKDLVWKQGSGNEDQAFWWGSSDRAPPQQTHRYLLASNRWFYIQNIHIFSQMYAFSAGSFNPLLRPRTVKVTVRYTDWWDWEGNSPLHMRSITPNTAIWEFPDSVETFALELESSERKKDELERQVQDILQREWRWRRRDGVYLKLDGRVGVKEWDWMGTTTFNGQHFAHHPKGDVMKYIVKVLTFNVEPRAKSG